MVTKYSIFGILTLLVLFMSFSSVVAIDLSFNSVAIKDTIVNDAGEPAVFDITIKNSGPTNTYEIDTFELFSITPKEFSLTQGQTKTIRFEFLPIDAMTKNIGHVSVPFSVREKGKSEESSGSVTIELVDFSSVFDVDADNIHLESDEAFINFYNIEDRTYNAVNISISSPFFEEAFFTSDFGPFEKKEFTILIDQEKLKKLVANTYVMTISYEVDGREATITRPIKILEKSGLSVKEESSGLIIRTKTIEKTNEGNIPVVAEISARKNIISRLFTTFSMEPLRVERNGFYVDYTWQEELLPTESLRVKVTTNSVFPLFIVIAIVALIYIFNFYLASNLVIKKRVNFVPTKGGEFALRVTVSVKARRFVERVRIYDRLPAMSKLYESFGTTPNNFNKQSGLMEWNIPRLGEGEERVFSYVIYSKLKVVGKFELPSATGVYDMDGKVHEARSNRTFFINELQEVKHPKHEQF